MTPQSLNMPVSVGSRTLTAPPRLRPRPDSDASGYIDATWWPRSSNLTAELPDLIAALRPRAGQIWRIVYDPRTWSTTDRHLIVAGRAMRLDRYPFELFGLMYLCATNGTVIVLRAIPEGTDPAVATSILAAAGRTARNDAARQ
jgi:hypothetical protein